MTKFSRIHKNRKMDMNRPPVGPLELIICVPGNIFYREIALWHQNCDLKHPECVYEQFFQNHRNSKIPFFLTLTASPGSPGL